MMSKSHGFVRCILALWLWGRCVCLFFYTYKLFMTRNPFISFSVLYLIHTNVEQNLLTLTQTFSLQNFYFVRTRMYLQSTVCVTRINLAPVPITGKFYFMVVFKYYTRLYLLQVQTVHAERTTLAFASKAVPQPQSLILLNGFISSQYLTCNSFRVHVLNCIYDQRIHC